MLGNVKYKILILLVLLISVIIAGIYYVNSSEQKKLTLMMQEQAKEKEQSLEKVIEFKSRSLSVFSYDYTSWDEMVNFIRKPTLKWAKENIDASLQNYNADFAWVYSPGMFLVYSTNRIKASGLDTIPIPVEHLQKIIEGKKTTHLFLSTKYGLIEIYGAAVHPSADLERKSQPYGYFLAGKLWDEKYLNEMAEVTGLSLKLLPLMAKSPTSNSPDADKFLIEKCKTIKDWEGKPVYDLHAESRVQIAETISKQSESQQLFIVLYSILLIVIISYILLRHINRPIKLLSYSLEANDTSALNKLMLQKNEFGRLAVTINQFFKQKKKLMDEVEERKQIEKALREIESRQHAMIANIADVIAVIDAGSLNKYESPNIEKWFGWKPDEVAGTKFSENIHPDDKPGFSDLLGGLIGKDNSTFNTVCRLKCKDGSYKWIELTAVNKINDNAINGILLNYHDITNKKEVEEVLQQRETQYRTMIEFSNDLIWAVDKSGKFTFLNSVAENTVGRKLETLKEMQFEEYVLKEDVPGIVEVFHKCMAGEPCSYEVHLIDAQQEIRTISVNNSPIYIGGAVAGMVSFGHDITNRIKAEKALKESEARYKSFVSQVSEGVYRYEMLMPMSIEIPFSNQIEFLCHNMVLAECNSTFEEMYDNGGAEALIGKTQRELHKRRDDRSNREVIENFINNGYRLVNFITSETDENGDVKYFSTNALGIIEDGFFIRMWGTQTDITDRKKNERDLIAAKVKAEEVNRLKSNFLANMSHELRTPLNGILGFAEILSMDLENPEQAIMASAIQESGKRLSETLNLILDLSKAETENFKVSTSHVNIVSVLEESAEFYKSLAEKKNLKLFTDIKEASIIVNLDGNLFLQVIKNILDNAIKYSCKGEITIEAEKSFEEGCHIAIVRIKDQGIGIPEEKLDIIWEEFRQVSEGINRGFEGLGLGLTISRKIVELMNGNISVESKLGEGSVFTIKFNLAELSPNEKEISTDSKNNNIQAKSVKSGNGDCNVLYVEDDVTNQTVAQLYLKNICNLDVAKNGETALKLINEKQYSAILMDINLGAGMDGLEVTKEVRKIEQYKCVPIIAVTAFAMSSDEDEFLKGGCTHYISKPFEREQFVSLVEKVLKG